MGTLYVNDEVFAAFAREYDDPKAKMQDVLEEHIESVAAPADGGA